MGRLQRTLRAMSFLATIMIVHSMHAQVTEEYINTGGISSNSLTFSIGEIFVVEEVPLKEKEQEYAQKVKAIPNPTGDAVLLRSEVKLTHLAVQIYDISGRLVSTQSIAETIVDFSGMPNGTYLIKSPINEFQPIKILKQ